MAVHRGPSTKWLFTREQLGSSPSRRCGVEADRELSYRQQAANLIQDIGQRLNVYPSDTVAARCTLARASLSFHGLVTVRDSESKPAPAGLYHTQTLLGSDKGSTKRVGAAEAC